MSISNSQDEQQPKSTVQYSLPTRVGNWLNEFHNKEDKERENAYKHDQCMKLIQRYQKLYRNTLRPVGLSSSPLVQFGFVYQIQSMGVYLAANVNEINVEIAESFQHGSGLVGTANKTPCVRNTFRFSHPMFSSPAESQIFYAQDVYIQLAESQPPLYVQCENFTIDTLGTKLKLRLTTTPDVYCKFKILFWDTELRQFLFTTIQTNKTVILMHTSTGKHLTLDNTWTPTVYGTEREVCCRVYRDCHKREYPENFWTVESLNL